MKSLKESKSTRTLDRRAVSYLTRANQIKPVQNMNNVVDVPFGKPMAKRRCRVCDAVIPSHNKMLLISRCCSTECQDRVVEMNQPNDFWPDQEVEESEEWD